MTDHDDDDFLINDHGMIHTETGEVEAHRKDDPTVWGLLDVARHRRPLVLTTIYKTSGDSASGVCGRLTPEGVFHPIHSTRIGQPFVVGLLHDVKPMPHEPRKTIVTAWDGAQPSPEFRDHAGNYLKEHTRGALLGDYQIHRDIDRGHPKTKRKNILHGLSPRPTAGTVSPQGRLNDGHPTREAA